MKTRILAIVGPTASGKTALSVELALRLNGEIVSCDSMQIYKSMDIATAKPTKVEMNGVKHHLIDIVKPDEEYSVVDYIRDATKAIEDITRAGKLPILVGGTGLYFNSLVDGIRFEETQGNVDIRSKLYAEAEQYGNAYMLEKLRGIDPTAAQSLHENNIKRVIRAIEVYEQTGITITEHRKKSREVESPYEPCIIGLDFTERELLYDRINKRVDLMLEQGLIEEARRFYNHPKSSTSAQAIGYKELSGYFDGTLTLEECIENLKRETRRYSKRQLTWFRRDKRVNWIYWDSFGEFNKNVDICENIYSNYCKNMIY